MGLRLYGDLPLVEPSELTEAPAPIELVIALDTSGSCRGELCRRFLRETLGLLQQLTDNRRRFRVLLLQCDDEIQDQRLLETPEELEALRHGVKLRGFGGTDFSPVFQRVRELRQSGVLGDVQCLLYFTDGYGAFPQEAPDYPACFLLSAPGKDDPVADLYGALPSWAEAWELNEDKHHLELRRSLMEVLT